MTPDAHGLERRALMASAAASLLVAVVGLWFANVADSQAVLLDGLFNAIYFVMSLLSLKVARLIQRPDDARFPFGYAHFEPLINTTKGLLILGVAVMALIHALGALFTGGNPIAAGSAIGYGIFASVVGFGTAGLQRYWSRRGASPLVAADVKNWTINGALSAVVALGFGLIFLIRGTRFESWDVYVDPALVTLLVLLTIGVPFGMVREGLLQLLNAAPDGATVARIERVLAEALGDVPAEGSVVRVLRSGRTLYALVHIVVDRASALRVADLDGLRETVAARVAETEPDLAADLIFTADTRWCGDGAAVTPTGSPTRE